MTTATGMVERIARVLEPVVFSYPVGSGHAPGECSYCDDERESVAAKARVVLECLRTPTPEMVEAMVQKIDWHRGEYPYPGEGEPSGPTTPQQDCIDAFAAAIDRALSPSRGEGE